jgi:Protein of unknown function (DUF2442)
MKSRILGMNTSNLEALAKKVTFDTDNMWVELVDGRQIGVPLAYFPRLAAASPTQRRKYLISGGGIGLHWESIDEDISVPALLQGMVDKTTRPSKKSKSAA